MYTIGEASGGMFTWMLTGDGGEVLLMGMRCMTSEGALAGVALARLNSGLPEQYRVRTAPLGGEFFELFSGNGTIIGASRKFHGAEERRRCLDQCMAHGYRAGLWHRVWPRDAGHTLNAADAAGDGGD